MQKSTYFECVQWIKARISTRNLKIFKYFKWKIPVKVVKIFTIAKFVEQRFRLIGQWITTTLRTVNGCGSSFACHFSAFDGRPTTPLSASRRVLWTRRVIILFIWRIFPCNEKITTQNSIEILFTLDEERKSDLSLNNFSKVSAKIKWKNSIQLSWWKRTNRNVVIFIENMVLDRFCAISSKL